MRAASVLSTQVRCSEVSGVEGEILPDVDAVAVEGAGCLVQLVKAAASAAMATGAASRGIFES